MSQKSSNRFYVGASRAKLNLYIISSMSLEDCAFCAEIIQKKKDVNDDDVSIGSLKTKNADKRFAASLNAILSH